MKDDAGEAEDERLRGFLLKHVVTVLGRLLHREVPPVSRYMLRELPKSVLYKHLESFLCFACTICYCCEFSRAVMKVDFYL